jgi:HNH endonuclease
MVIQIPLRYGWGKSINPKHRFAIIDDEDYELISKYKWYIFDTPYTCYARAYANKGKTTILMHNLIVKAKGIDHINRDGLDNRKANLRLATQSQNNANKGKQDIKTASSKYKGVTWGKYQSKWIAQIMKDRKNYYIGAFSSEIEAAAAYDKKAIELFGEFARINFPETM